MNWPSPCTCNLAGAFSVTLVCWLGDETDFIQQHRVWDLVLDILWAKWKNWSTLNESIDQSSVNIISSFVSSDDPSDPGASDLGLSCWSETWRGLKHQTHRLTLNVSPVDASVSFSLFCLPGAETDEVAFRGGVMRQEITCSHLDLFHSAVNICSSLHKSFTKVQMSRRRPLFFGSCDLHRDNTHTDVCVFTVWFFKGCFTPSERKTRLDQSLPHRHTFSPAWLRLKRESGGTPQNAVWKLQMSDISPSQNPVSVMLWCVRSVCCFLSRQKNTFCGRPDQE